MQKLLKTLTAVLLTLTLLIPPAIAQEPALEQTLQMLTLTLQQLQETVATERRRDNLVELKSRLSELKQQVIDSDPAVQTDFAQVEATLNTLPAMFQERHEQALSHYQQNLGILLENLDAIENTAETSQLMLQTGRMLQIFSSNNPNLKVWIPINIL